MDKVKLEEWMGMTRRDRRVAIAQDVIERIQKGVFHPRASFGYIRGPIPDNIRWNEYLTEDDIDSIAHECHVCARGALLLSRIAKFNSICLEDVKMEPTDDEGGIVFSDGSVSVTCGATAEGLEGAFTREELDVIEAVFETSFSNHCVDGQLNKNWLEMYPESKERLLAICQNIVEYGTFIPQAILEFV